MAEPIVVVLDTGFVVAQAGGAEPARDRTPPGLHVANEVDVLIDRDRHRLTAGDDVVRGKLVVLGPLGGERYRRPGVV